MNTFRPRGIISVLQTPFDAEGGVDEASQERLVEDAIAAGVDGFLVPVVASEVAELTSEERELIVRRVAQQSHGRVPVVVGASSADPQECCRFAQVAESVGATAYLVAVPNELYGSPEKILGFFQRIARSCPLPLLIQDLQFGGPGMTIETIQQLQVELPTLAGLKIETLPAGSKYTAVRNALGPDFFIAGGWAVPQMIEALDRGVDAMIPESAMVRVYVAIDRAHRAERRERAIELFRELVPILAFSNQELLTSIAFFKRLLTRKGIFSGENLRAKGFAWDTYNRRIADELIDHYLELEARVEKG